MPETIEVYVENVGEISPISVETLSVELTGVDLGQLIEEIGFENILDELKVEDIEQYLKDRAERETTSE